MRKKIYILGLVIIIILGVFFQGKFGDYYSTPEEALKHDNEFNDISMKNIIQTVWIDDNTPIIFYVSNSDNFCAMEFNEKEVLGKIGWKSGIVSTIDKKTIDPNILMPSMMESGKDSSGNKGEVVYGITKSPEANTIKENEEIPTFVNFEIEGQDYVLWYVIRKW